MNIRSKLTGMTVKNDEPLRLHTSLRIGGNALFYYEAENIDKLCANLKIINEEESFPIFVLGGGSNILFSDDGFDGYVISIKGFGEIKEINKDSDGVLLDIGAGVGLQQVLRYAKDNGYMGIEGLSGIPGTIGGAVFGNAGSYGTEIGSLVKSVKVIDKTGNIKDKTDIKFGYRSSSLPLSDIIVGIRLLLKKGIKEEIAEHMKEILEKKRATQPIDKHSAGCVFKNPQGDYAGRLIEVTGCKGLRQGGIAVSEVHANFFINDRKGTCNDFLKLMDDVKERVYKGFGVELEPEIKIIPKEIVNGGIANI